MKVPIDWLLKGEPWIQYRTRRDLLSESEHDRQVGTARESMLADGRLQSMLESLSCWPGAVLASHKSAGQPFHRLTFVADMGLVVDDPGVERIVSRILEHQSEEGPFQLLVNIPQRFGGTGQDLWAWALCDAPLIVYALARFGLAQEPVVTRAVEYLMGLVRDVGWPCVASKELGSFRGPGRKGDPCPYATLAMLKALSTTEDWRNGTACHVGSEALLSLWDESTSRHPFIFYMGTDFRKLKVPFVWYDLVHVLDVLSQFTWLKGDARLTDMLDVLKGKADTQGRFTPESVWTAWKEWEFCQKRQPSRWLTLVAWRIIRRLESEVAVGRTR